MIDAAIRVAVLLASAWLITASMRRAAASTRHLVWTVAVIGALAMPVLSMVSPRWQVLPGPSADALRDLQTATARQLPTANYQIPTSPATKQPDNLEAGNSLGVRGFAVGRSLGVGSWDLGFAVWGAVASLLLCRIALGIAAVRRVARHARPVDARWNAILAAARSELRIRDTVRIGICSDVTMPMTYGHRHPILLLPDAAGEWTDERARVVLLHELAHIARRDWTTNLLARVLAALHWFNPLAWIAVRRMTAERERACDNCVLTHGATPADYAAHLLDIARAQSAPMFAAAALAMARPSELEGRLLSILTQPRRRAGRLAPIALSIAAIALTVIVASAAPAASPGAPPAGLARVATRPPARATWMYDSDTIHREREEARHARATVKPLAATALHDSDEGVREEATLALAMRSDPDVVDALIAALKDESSQVREKAALGLSLRRDPRVVDALIEAAGDPDSQVREKVILALSLSGDTRALDTITASLEDPDPQVREKAASGLALFPAGDAIRKGLNGALDAFGKR